VAGGVTEGATVSAGDADGDVGASLAAVGDGAGDDVGATVAVAGGCADEGAGLEGAEAHAATIRLTSASEQRRIESLP
jgi:hypothetical protein